MHHRMLNTTDARLEKAIQEAKTAHSLIKIAFKDPDHKETSDRLWGALMHLNVIIKIMETELEYYKSL